MTILSDLQESIRSGADMDRIVKSYALLANDCPPETRFMILASLTYLLRLTPEARKAWTPDYHSWSIL